MNRVVNLGTANGWKDTPGIVKECREAGHETQGSKISNCYYEVRCDKCGYVYRYDSS